VSAPDLRFDAAVPAPERELLLGFLGDDAFRAATLRNVLRAPDALTFHLRPLAGHPGSNKVLYRVDVPGAGAFVLKHALKRGFLFLRPKGTFKWREIAYLRRLDGHGVTPRFGAHARRGGREAFTEELIEGVTAADPRFRDDPARARELARMWMTVSRLLTRGAFGLLWRVPGSTMAPGNAMYRVRDGAVSGTPVVIDVGTARWRTPARILGKLFRSHGHAAAVLDGVADALGGPGARRFFRRALPGLGGEEELRNALRARV
jgi:hypothetical protein